MSLKLLVALTVVVAVVAATDYCKLCSDHIACNNPGVPSDNCSSVIELTDGMKKQIIEIHNKLRNQQASGQTPGFEPAARMGTIQWDDELAQLAKLNAMRCWFGHDKCRKTDLYPGAGQNIAGSSINGAGVTFEKPESVIDSQTSNWFDEYKIADMSPIKAFHGSGDPNNEWGHFTQIVRDASDRIGCAMSQYVKPGEWLTNYLVCDYAYTNLVGSAVYEVGPAASKCTTGPNPNFPALCSESEKYEY